MRQHFYHIVLLLLLVGLNCHTYAGIAVDVLRCEHTVEPAGIDIRLPRLSWEMSSNVNGLEQTAYHVMVASSMQKLAEGKGDLWNSGKVVSDISHLVRYKGKALASGQGCYWKVRVWTNQGVSDWSRPASWSMGLLNKADWTAHWIGYDGGFGWDSISKFSRLSARYLRRAFDATSAIRRATVYIAGLGHYELYVNGSIVGDQVLAETPTDYTKSVKYNRFDVTGLCRSGKNVIGVVLGNGRYFTMRPKYKPQKIKEFGYPKLLLQLEITYEDGRRERIVSDGKWKFTADGPIRTNNEYDGEEYDATKELTGWNASGFDDSQWINAALVEAPGGRMSAQMNASIKVMRTVRPLSVKELRPGTWIMDMGQNFAGWVKIKVKGDRGTKVTLRYAETLASGGDLYLANLRDAKVTDIYTLKGGGTEEWHPVFVYHGFRYVSIEGYSGRPSLNDFEGQVIYDNLATIGEFRTSDTLINHIYRNAWWGIAANYKGMPVDCPQRNERMPWLGDRATGSLGESYLFDNINFYAKWLDDIAESQRADGAIPDVAPAYWNYYSDNMTWPGTYILVADMLYRQYGDPAPIVRHYPSMKRWLDHMRVKYGQAGLIMKDKYGDWCVPPESPELIHSKDSLRTTDGGLIASAYYYRLLNLMEGFARLQHKRADASGFARLAAETKLALNKRWLFKDGYSNNAVTANLLPYYFGLTPETERAAIFARLTNTIEKDYKGHIPTGVIGTQWLMRGLTRNGRADLAWQIATNRDYPGWGHMVGKGATTIWELWNGDAANPAMNSQNHVMLLGDLISWMYEDLAGIAPDGPGFKTILMRPAMNIQGLDSVSASYNTPYGIVRSHWKKEGLGIVWDVHIPGNAHAKIYLSDSVREIGSGDYHFMIGRSESGEFIYDTAPFPECHAATIAETPKGLVTAWFGGTKERNPDVCIYVSRKDKGSPLWTTPVNVANGIQNDTLRYPTWNPVLFQQPGGELLLFYKVGPSPSTWKGWMMRSKDGGASWSAAEALPEGYLGPIKNKPVLLTDGTLICPSSTEGHGWKVHFELTRDGGRHWETTGLADTSKSMQAIQPSVLSYRDGRLQALCRSQQRAILETWSDDQGKTWSPLRATDLPNNNSGTDAVTLADGRQLLVYNHVLPPPGQSKGERSPLNVAVSADGKNWYASVVLENDTLGQYSYPGVIQGKDGLVHIVYTWHRKRIKHVVLDPAKLPMVKIENGIWPVSLKKQ